MIVLFFTHCYAGTSVARRHRPCPCERGRPLIRCLHGRCVCLLHSKLWQLHVLVLASLQLPSYACTSTPAVRNSAHQVW